MNLRSHLNIRVHPGQRAAAVAAFSDHRIFEECAEEIPGFIRAEILLSQDDPDRMCVVTYWRDAAASDRWRASPVREAQSRDLGKFAAEMPTTELFEIMN